MSDLAGTIADVSVVSIEYHQYINGPAWGKKRRERLDYDGRKCVRCESTERLEVHHLTYDRLGSERMDDLVTLCHICHAKDHGRDPSLPPAESDLTVIRRIRDREGDEYRLEMWQTLFAGAVKTIAMLEWLFEGIYWGEEDKNPRVRRIRRDLDAIMRTAARNYDAEWMPDARESEVAS